MNLKQVTILLLGSELQYIIAGWPPVIGTLLGAALCLSIDHYIEARNEYSENKD